MLKYLLKLFACMNNFSIKLERGLFAAHKAAPLCRADDRHDVDSWRGKQNQFKVFVNHL